jgi:methyl-accepting chemotaxis protein
VASATRQQAAAMAENAEGMQHIHGSLQVLQQVVEQLDVSASALAEEAQHLAGHASAFHTG